MPSSEALRAALQSLRAHRLRSVLTMSGVVIGVAAVILLVALGSGIQADFNLQFGKLANQIVITPGGESNAGVAKRRDLSDDDVEQLRRPGRAPHIESVSPSVSGDIVLTVAQNKAKANATGATYNYNDLLDRDIAAGRWFLPGEIDQRQRKVLLGPTTVDSLWGPGIPPAQLIGRTVRLDRTNFTLIGVFTSDGQKDNIAVVPFDAARAYLLGNQNSSVDAIAVKATGVGDVQAAVGEINAVLDDAHQIRKPVDRDFTTSTFVDVLSKSSAFLKYLSWFVTAIAGISLFVGGIGVANIMLVSVTERTREIGIRKAVGARRSDVLRQFLGEAVIITGIGGLIGVALGVGAVLVILLVTRRVQEFPPPVLAVAPAVVAMLISMVIGLVAGIYPAYRAGSMKPIDALRFE